MEREGLTVGLCRVGLVGLAFDTVVGTRLPIRDLRPGGFIGIYDGQKTA